MASQGVVTDTDKGAVRLLETVKGSPCLDVGIIGAKADASRGRFTVGEIAGVHEFGSATVPKRSFIGSWFDAHQAEMSEHVRRCTKLLLEGKIDAAKWHTLVGVKAVGGIQKHISEGISPPLKPATVARKKSSKPLIDTGIMRSSITWREVKP